MGDQVQVLGVCVDKQRLGYPGVSLTHMSDSAEPRIAAGSKVEIGGALYQFSADETGTGWAGIGASNTVYILVTPSGTTCAWSYTTTAPTWSTSKQGFYIASDRVIGGLYKDAGGNYTAKWLYAGMDMVGPVPRLLQEKIEIGNWNMDTTNTVSVAHGLNSSKIVGVKVLLRNDDDSRRTPLDGSNTINPPAGNYFINGANVEMWRAAAGIFDNADYDSVGGYNRGWIVVEYEP